MPCRFAVQVCSFSKDDDLEYQYMLMRHATQAFSSAKRLLPSCKIAKGGMFACQVLSDEDARGIQHGRDGTPII